MQLSGKTKNLHHGISGQWSNLYSITSKSAISLS